MRFYLYQARSFALASKVVFFERMGLQYTFAKFETKSSALKFDIQLTFGEKQVVEHQHTVQPVVV